VRNAGASKSTSGFREFARRFVASPGPGSTSPKIFHRRAGPSRFDRVQSRVPMGLRFLQRVDLLRTQLPR
jgi:hypothetical protein